MKNILIVTTLLASIAARASYEAIPQNRLEDFKIAAIQGMHWGLDAGKLKECIITHGSISESTLISNFVKSATYGQIQSEGEQPILLFGKKDSDNSKQKYLVTIVSTANFKEVAFIKLEKFELQDMNTGTMRNPKIEPSDALIWAFECK